MTMEEPLICPVHLIHPDTAAYLDGRQSEQKNLCVAWPIAALMLIGCAHHPTRPVTAGARDSLSQALTASSEASAASKEAGDASKRAGEHIRVFKSDVERAQAKDEVIRQWEQRQAIKHHST